jgi:hypothetical protein
MDAFAGEDGGKLPAGGSSPTTPTGPAKNVAAKGGGVCERALAAPAGDDGLAVVLEAPAPALPGDARLFCLQGYTSATMSPITMTLWPDRLSQA